jgi:hypothetical protein
MENEHECGAPDDSVLACGTRCGWTRRVGAKTSWFQELVFFTGSKRRPATGVERTGEAARALPNAMRVPLMSRFVHANNEYE